MRKSLVWILSLLLVVAMFGCFTVSAEAKLPTAIGKNITNEAEGFDIDRTYNLSADYVAENVQAGVNYTDITEALFAAAEGETVMLLQNTACDVLSVQENTTLDLNGYEVTAKYASVFGHIIDSSAENTGTLKVDDNKLLINTENKQLPVKTDKGYRFVEIVGFNTSWLSETTFVFQPVFEAAACDMLKNGAAVTGVSIQINVTWRPFEGSEDLDSRTFKYGDNLVTQYVNSYNVETGKFGRMFTLTLVNPENYVDLQCNTKVVSTTRVEFTPAKGSTVVSQQIQLTSDQASALVAEGTKVQDAGMELILSTTEMETSTVVAGEGETARAMDIHVAGIAKDNTVPVIVTVNEMTVGGLNEGNIKLYHVEDGTPVEMTRVYTVEEVDEHNEYYYDIATGDVTMALKSFSEVAVVADDAACWKGEIDTSWYDENKDTYELFNADQLAGFGALVDGGNTFEGKTVRLMLSVNLGGEEGGKCFNPIGFGYEFVEYDYPECKGYGKVFKGVFDGNGNTIYNLYQNCWLMGADTYTYSAVGAGLFASVVDAEIKNLTMDGAQIVLECVDMGTVVGYANGNCNFENIVVRNSVVANHNRATGGVIGEVGGGGTYTLNNVDVEKTTTISGLWGSFGISAGGLIGCKWGAAGTQAGKDTDVSVTIKNCDVACVLDVYNDVTSAYQWYAYRFCGMLIGHTEEWKTTNGRTVATASWLTAENCTVQYGDWVNYTYCRFNNTTSLGARYPWVRVEPGLFTDPYSNIRYGVPQFAEGAIDPETHIADMGCHIEGDEHCLPIIFNQLYGGDQGVYGGNGHIGAGVTIIDAVTNTTKFVSKVEDGHLVKSGTTIKLGSLFKAAENVDIQSAYVHAFVSPTSADSTARGSFTPEATQNWENLEIEFTGLGEVTILISDYYYCTPTVIKVNVVDSIPHDAHCCCGGAELSENAPHECKDIVDWQPLTVDLFELAYDSNGTLYGYKFKNVVTGHYFLNEDLKLDRAIYTQYNQDITICLNGHTLSRDNQLITISGNLTICDCVGTGACESSYNSFGGTLRISRGGTVNVYGGTYTNLKEAGTGGAVVFVGRSVYSATGGTAANNVEDKSTFNFYGGTLSGGKTTGNGGNLIVYSTKCTFNMYGGIIENGEATGDGGNVYTNGTVNLLGGTITGGKAAGNDNDVYINDGTLTIGGKMNIGSIYLNDKTFKIHSNGLTTTTTPIKIIGDEGVFATNVSSDLSRYFDPGEEYKIVYNAEAKTLSLEKLAHKRHCVCKGADLGLAEHTCEYIDDWQPLTTELFEDAKSGDTTYGYKFKADGHYFLEGDLVPDKAIYIQYGQNITICLNGHKLSRSGQLFTIAGNLTICDCEGTGQCEGKYAGSSGGCLRVSRGANLNIYGGTYTNLAKAKTEYGGAVVILTNTAYTGTAAGSAPYGCTFNFYGGTITGGQTTGSGGNLNVYSDSCIFNMYGGIIEKGQADDNGGNIQSYGTVNLLGGTICGGDAAKNGDDVYINGGTLTIGGDIQIGSIYLNGKSFKIHSSGLNTTTTPIEIVGTGEFATNVVDDLSACFTAAGEIVYDAAKKTLTIIQ